jgi:TonB family protein
MVHRSAACDELYQREEGWVQLSFMVDTAGKPYEIAVIHTTGNKTLNKEATGIVARSTFEPATLNGKPIESVMEFKVHFENLALAQHPGAGSAFISAYRALTGAVAANDRPAADAALGKLKITNLYEDAYFGLATYSYASKWGNEAQQLEGLSRAIAEENLAHYLPTVQFKSALLACLKLQLKAQLYAEAITTWKRLEKLGADESTAAQVRLVFDRLEKLRSDDSAYEVSGSMPEGQWHLHLFKRHFKARISEGSIAEVRLRCQNAYVSFAFDPQLQYQVPDKYGECSIQLDGKPGTQFMLVQF